MRPVEFFWLLLIGFLVLSLAGVLTLSMWWLWRKITLPEGAPPPRWADFSGLKAGLGRGPVVLRLVVVGILGLLMSAPIGLIYDLITERATSYQEVVQELSLSWGGRQLLIGPLLQVPYTIKYRVTEEVPLTEAEIKKLPRRSSARTTRTVTREVSQNKTALILPEELKISGRLNPEMRYRGIYSVRVYTAELALAGHFQLPDFKTLDKRVDQVHWASARLLVNLSDTKAFRGISPLSLGADQYKFRPGTNGCPVAPTGFSAEVDLEKRPTRLPFDFSMAVGGSQGLFLAPVAAKSAIDLQSSWPHPKYCGDGLPTQSRQSAEGFEAGWEIPNLVRNYAQFGDMEAFFPGNFHKVSYEANSLNRQNLPLAEYVVGVDLFEPVFHYSILTRAVKYAMMFIALTFLSVLIFEIAARRAGGVRLHVAQYGLIGLGLCLFYLVLLAASEHLPFLKAYLLASGLNILLIGGYVRAALGRKPEALMVSGLLVALYADLYYILRMEEYALVSGTSLLVLALIGLMHATRNLGRPEAPENRQPQR